MMGNKGMVGGERGYREKHLRSRTVGSGFYAYGSLVVGRVAISPNPYPRHIGVVGSPVCPIAVCTPLNVSAGITSRRLRDRTPNDSASSEGSKRVPPTVVVSAITWARVPVTSMAVMPAGPNARRAMHTAPSLMTSTPDSFCLYSRERVGCRLRAACRAQGRKPARAKPSPACRHPPGS